MENQTNYPPQQPQKNSSGANTVLIIIAILIIVGFGYWWYTHQQKVVPATPDTNNPSINVDVNLPTDNPSAETTSTTTE